MVLEKVNFPDDLKRVEKEQLPKLANEIREVIINTVSKTGGHLAPSLGCVELAIAIHYVFDTPKDQVVWDVGHQSYAHKILTGRKDRFQTLRQHDGLSGFPKRVESAYDPVGTGHSSTSISAALGLAVARDIKGENHKVVAVIGDGSMTGGMAFEALNNAGSLHNDMLVILNDNAMFISHSVGALAAYFTKILTLGLVKKFEKTVETFFRRLHFLGVYMLRIAKRFKLLFFPGMLFEEMGFSYLGPIDGHDLELLITTLERIKDFKGPVLLHVITRKGKGYSPAEKQPAKFHGTPAFSLEEEDDEILSTAGYTAGTQQNDGKKVLTYTQVFSKSLVKLAENDTRICAVTAAMPEGTGLGMFAQKFPDRFFDVGIAEQHAVTFASGLAVNGMRPVVAMYSTFMQRAVDQLIHDVALQNLPVTIVLDRGGLVGEDGPTHHGVFDLSYLRMIPNLVIMSPRDENELQRMLYTAVKLDRPVAVRYPRGYGYGVELEQDIRQLEVGKAEVVHSVKGRGVITVLGIGNMVIPAVRVAEKLAAEDKIEVQVIDMKFVKPLDTCMIDKVLSEYQKVVTVEENVLTGGFGSGVGEYIGSKYSGVKLLNIALPDKFIEHGKVVELHKIYGLSEDKLCESIRQFAGS
ncbi:MAG: 1-deoxy-D-xylulose-5-phosphate synthase [Elusimicrobiota bacterium]